MNEFGHIGIVTSGFCIDIWGAGPFTIEAGGKSFRFEDSDRFGPALVNKNGDPLTKQWPSERSPFWRAYAIWRQQGRRLEGGRCIYDKPRPSIVRHIRGKDYQQIEAGEEHGVTLVRTPEGDISLRDYKTRPQPKT